MKTMFNPQNDGASRTRPAASRDKSSSGLSFEDNRVGAAGRSALVQTVEASPLATVQRQQMATLFGGTVQMAEEEEMLQGKMDPAQRASLDEEEPMQGKAVAQLESIDDEELMQGKAASGPRQLALQRAPGEAASSSSGLPSTLRAGVESLSGISMGGVNVHYNSSRPSQVQAYAYTQGSDIYVGPGQEKHLPHEAWHVVQQASGRVQPTMRLDSGTEINDEAVLEHEADVMGARSEQAGRTAR